MTTFEILIDKLDRIERELLMPEGDNNYNLSAQLGSIKKDLELLLWIELPELNDAEKYEALYQGNSFKFGETFLERRATRLSFWKRLARKSFTEDQDKRDFVKLAEKQFKDATLSWQEFMWGKKE